MAWLGLAWLALPPRDRFALEQNNPWRQDLCQSEQLEALDISSRPFLKGEKGWASLDQESMPGIFQIFSYLNRPWRISGLKRFLIFPKLFQR